MLSFISDLFCIEIEGVFLILKCKITQVMSFEVLRVNLQNSKLTPAENLDCYVDEMSCVHLRPLCITQLIGEDQSVGDTKAKPLFIAYIQYVLLSLHSCMPFDNLQEDIEELYDFIILCLVLENEKNGLSMFNSYL